MGTHQQLFQRSERSGSNLLRRCRAHLLPMFCLPGAYVSTPPGRRPRRSWPPSRRLRFSLLTSLCQRFAYVLPTLQETASAASNPFIVVWPERRGAEKSEYAREENRSGDRSWGQPGPPRGGPRPQLSPIRNRPQRHPSRCGRSRMSWEVRRDGPRRDHGGEIVPENETLSGCGRRFCSCAR